MEMFNRQSTSSRSENTRDEDRMKSGDRKRKRPAQKERSFRKLVCKRKLNYDIPKNMYDEDLFMDVDEDDEQDTNQFVAIPNDPMPGSWPPASYGASTSFGHNIGVAPNAPNPNYDVLMDTGDNQGEIPDGGMPLPSFYMTYFP